jgi:hypothetical protein
MPRDDERLVAAPAGDDTAEDVRHRATDIETASMQA